MNALRHNDSEGILCRDGCMADDLHLDVVGIKAQLVHIAASIEELKESLAPLKELGHAFARMDERIMAMQKHQELLTASRDEHNDLASKMKGGLAVALFLFTIIQGLLGWGWSTMLDRSTKMESDIKALKENQNEPNLPNRQPR